MQQVFQVVGGQILLMFLYMLVGFVLYRVGLITAEGSKTLAHLLLYCVLPCVILKSFCVEYTAQGARELAVSIAAAAAILLLSMSVALVLFRGDAIAQVGVAFSNAGFMGLPLVTAVLGSEAVFYAAGFVALLAVCALVEFLLDGKIYQNMPFWFGYLTDAVCLTAAAAICCRALKAACEKD